jgi:superfamily II DNA or RNA helicase
MDTLRFEPRRWQLEALAAWNRSGHRGIVEVATGGGKTLFAELCLDAIARETAAARFVILVPTEALLDQWYVSLREDLGIDDADLALWSGRSTSSASAARRVNVMIINTARWAARQITEALPTMLIVDECHRAGSPANAAALQGPHVATLGMSATPEREHDEGFERHIVPALGPIIYRYDINAAIADGVLAPFDLINVAVNLLADERRKYDDLSRRIGRLAAIAQRDPSAESRLELLLRRRARLAALAAMRVPVAVHLVEQHRGVRALIFHESIAQAELLLTNLRGRGHSVTIYHSRVGPSLRRDNLRHFRRGVFDVLISCRALDEGINIPETRIAVIASGTASHRQRIQRLGRVLRPAPGKERATVYTIYATPFEVERLVKEAARLTSADSVTWRRSGIAGG